MQDRIQYEVKDKVIIVTGASRGIGRGMVELFAESGAHVVAVARKSRELNELEEMGNNRGWQLDVFETDLRNVTDICACVKCIYEKVGKVDALVNNAGMGNPIPVLEVQEKDWDEMVDLNMKGTYFFTQQVALRMKEQGGGKIVMMSSQASVVGIENESIYCATKGGINQMVKVMAMEWAKYGIRVNCVGPTFVYTPGTAERLDDPEFYQGVVSKIPMGKVATIKDVTNAVNFFLSDASDMITGTLLLVDGGWTLA